VGAAAACAGEVWAIMVFLRLGESIGALSADLPPLGRVRTLEIDMYPVRAMLF